jgi:hypothetical protein
MSDRPSRAKDKDVNKVFHSEEIVNESGPGTRLERRRRIEDLFEERRLREELNEFEKL